MRRTATLLALTALLCGGAAACGSDDSTVDSGGTATTTEGAATVPANTDFAAVLDGQTFAATSVTGYDLAAAGTLSMSFADGMLSVSGGCNGQSAGYEVDDDQLTLTSDMASTEMACDEDLMAQDAWIAGLLAAGVTLSGTAEALTMTSGDVVIELAPEAATGDGTLEGVTWTLESIIDGDTASSLPAGAAPPTMVFAADGTVEVFAGCNNGGTAYMATDATLTFEPMRTTMMACEPDATALETAMTTMLDGDVVYELDGNSLSLTKGTQSLVFQST